MWWIIYNLYGVYMVCGVYGQVLYVDFIVCVVIVWFVLYFIVSNSVNDFIILFVFDVIVCVLMVMF